MPRGVIPKYDGKARVIFRLVYNKEISNPVKSRDNTSVIPYP